MPLLQRAIGVLCLIAVAPAIALLSLLVLLSLGRPVFFVQNRSGLNQQTFGLIKLRSMTNERGPGGELLPDELRVTRLGRWLRRTRLDELPGFLNVARGEIALIGPRPLLPDTIEAMGPEGRIRSTVPPGMTGWSQVNGNTLLSDFQKLQLDIWYIDNRSLGIDLRILWRTLLVMLRGEKLT